MSWLRIKSNAAFVCGKYHFIREGCVEPRGPAMRIGGAEGLAGEQPLLQLSSRAPSLLWCPTDRRGTHPYLACLPREIIANFGIIMPPAEQD